MNPASTMKLLTTYAALEILGPAYQWHTDVYAASHPHGGRLDGDLILRGSGDPSLVIERFWVLVHRLRGLGLRQLQGNLVLDKSAFEPNVESGSPIDGNGLRPYNVAPDALLVNFKTLTLEFVERLRGERRFETVEALVEQMNQDVERTRQLCE